MPSQLAGMSLPKPFSAVLMLLTHSLFGSCLWASVRAEKWRAPLGSRFWGHGRDQVTNLGPNIPDRVQTPARGREPGLDHPRPVVLSWGSEKQEVDEEAPFIFKPHWMSHLPWKVERLGVDLRAWFQKAIWCVCLEGRGLLPVPRGQFSGRQSCCGTQACEAPCVPRAQGFPV